VTIDEAMSASHTLVNRMKVKNHVLCVLSFICNFIAPCLQSATSVIRDKIVRTELTGLRCIVYCVL